MVAAYVGGPADYDRFLAEYRTTTSPTERSDLLFALPMFKDPDLARRTLDLAMSDQVRSGDAPSLIGSLVASESVGDVAWAFVKQHWDEILDRFSPLNIPDLLSGVTARTKPEQAADVEQFLNAHPVPIATQEIARDLEQLRINTALRQREAPNVAAYFGAGR